MKLNHWLLIAILLSAATLKAQDSVDVVVQDSIKPVPAKKAFFLYENSEDTEMTSEMRRHLDNVSNYLKDHTEAEVRITGHSDNSGTLEENMEISTNRAARAANYLKKKGIGASRIFERGMGSMNPLASNKSKHGRKMNRRLEINIMD